MKTRQSVLFVIALVIGLGGRALAQAPQPKLLEETQKFIDGSPDHKKWFEETSKYLHQQMVKVTKELEALKDDTRFRLPAEIKEGKKPSPMEWEARKKIALRDVVSYTNSCERHLLAVLAAAKLKDDVNVQKRVLQTPPFTLYMFPAEHSSNSATTGIAEQKEEAGKIKVVSIKTGFGTLAFRAKSTAHTINHELFHVFIQRWDNETNDKQIPTPPNLIKTPVHKIKPFKYVRGNYLLTEGVTELLTQRALELVGEVPVGATYINQVGGAALIFGIDERAITEWYVGVITNQEFSERFQASLKQVFLVNKKIDDKTAEGNAFSLTNMLLDDSHPLNGIMGQRTDPMVTFSEFNRGMRIAGVDHLEILRKQLPAEIHRQYSGLKKPEPKKEEPKK
jgi:hypothetical protein